MMGRAWTVAATLAATALSVGQAAAQPVEQPLELALDHALERSNLSARRWHYSWVGIFSAGVVAQGVLVGVESDDNGRIAQAVGAVPPTVGLVLQLAQPLAALQLDEDLENLLANSFDEETRVAEKHRLLSLYAESEAQQRNWFAHAGPIFLNASIAGVLLWALDKPVQAAIQLGAGVAISEIRVWTSPQTATDALAGLPPPAASVGRVWPVTGWGYWGLAGTF
jgi:hypothetical protein